MIILFGSIGWVIGYFREDFMVVFQVWFVGVVLSVIVSDGTERNGTRLYGIAACLVELVRVELTAFGLMCRFACRIGRISTDTR